MDSVFFERLSQHLDTILLCVDEQRRQLEDLFLQFVSKSQGESVLVAGPRLSARRATILQALDVARCKGVDVFHVDVGMMGSDTHALQMLVDNNEQAETTIPKNSRKKCDRKNTAERRIIVVHGADELATRSKQVLLYKLLNATRVQPWLVLLIVNRQDFLSCLEKRIRSRVSSKKIQFTGTASSWDEYLQCIQQMLTPRENCPEWERLVRKLFEEPRVLTLLKMVYEAEPSLSLLKRVLCVFIGYLVPSGPYAAHLFVGDLIPLFEESVELCLPVEHHCVYSVKSLSLRSQCLLMCVMRRFRFTSTDMSTSFRKIVTDYKHLCNVADRRMGGPTDIELFKELDSLCDLRLLDAPEKNTINLAYRRVSLRCCPQALQDALEHCDVPINIREWFMSQPTN